MEAIEEIKEGFKKTKIGWIPEEWDSVKLREVTVLISGQHLIPAEYSASKVGVPYFTGPTDFKDDVKSILKWTENGKKYANNGDILITVKGSGVGHLFRLTLEEIAIGRQLMAIRGKNSYTPFIFYQLFPKLYRFRKLASGNMIPGLSRHDIETTYIPLPPLPEQKKIAEILSTWDEAITETQNLISQLKTRKKGLMQQLLTGKKRLKGFSGEWEEFQFDEILENYNRPIEWDDDELYELISVRRRSGGLFRRESLFGREILTKNLRTALYGDFLISKMQIVHGASGLVTKEFNGMKISGSYLALRAKNEDILNMKFFNYISKTPYFYHQSYIASYGVHIEKMTFNFKTFLKLKTKLPSTKEQKAIVEILDNMEKEIKVQSQYLKELQSQKKGLMQKLLTGQIRVNT